MCVVACQKENDGHCQDVDQYLNTETLVAVALLVKLIVTTVKGHYRGGVEGSVGK